MKRVLHTTLAAALLVSAAAAQYGPPPGGPRGHDGFGPGGFGPGMHSGKVITNAPYSATATSTFTQTLANGNTIQRTITASVARDSVGRTYTQETITGGPFATNNGPTTLTFISDPTTGYSYVLNATTNVATRRQLHTPPAGSVNTQQWRSSNKPANPNVVTTDLGPSTVNGVSVTGKTTTRTIPAGQIGNAQAITATTTTWYSPTLHVVVSSTRNDPRTGSEVYALTGISTQPPAETLFQVPSNYTIQDAKPFGHGPHGPPTQQ